jgi:hypothetical protein
MDIKLTKRKGFNFFRSYFDVYNELSDKDKIKFIDALLDKQFLGVEPENLDGIVKFAYLSQKHSIDKQVKGWEDKTGLKLSDAEQVNNPSQDPAEGCAQDPNQQEEEKEEEKGKEQDVYFTHETFIKHC